MKTYTIDQVQDTLIGEKGTPERDIFEYELQMDLIGKAIKQSRNHEQATHRPQRIPPTYRGMEHRRPHFEPTRSCCHRPPRNGSLRSDFRRLLSPPSSRCADR